MTTPNYFDQNKPGFPPNDVQEGDANAAYSVATEAAAKVPQLAREALDRAKQIPELIDEQLKENPYRLLGIVGAVGVGVGMLIGSKVMRALVVSVGGYALTEGLRGYVAEQIQAKQIGGPSTH